MKLKMLVVLIALLFLGTVHDALAFYNPTSGKWLSRDPLKEKGGVNLYSFVRNDPNDIVDKDGRIGIGQRIRGLFYCGKCGPDVTDAVATTLADVEAEFLNDKNFSSWTTPDEGRYEACKNLFDPKGVAENAWEILPLGLMGLNSGSPKAKHLPAGITSGDFAQGGQCGGTVTFHGRCVWASALNYMVFGRMCKLCNDKFSSKPFQIHPINPITGNTVNWTVRWTRTDMVAAILYHKYKGRGGLLRNPQAQMAALYADAAYNGYGDIGALYRELIPCDTQGVKTWPNTVMPWKWVGVHLSADTE